jgi:hypothetical protein
VSACPSRYSKSSLRVIFQLRNFHDLLGFAK